MWFLMKSTLSVVLLGVVAYGVFLVDLGGKPLFDHLREVWGSEVVQQKVGLVREGVVDQLEDRLAAAAETSARKARREVASEELDPKDREALEKVIDPGAR